MKAYLIFLSAIFAGNLMAFGQTGHRITGAIAEQHLDPKAKAAIEAIIGNESLAEASTFVDEMKSNPKMFWQKTASPYHYVTVPEGKVYADVGAPEKGDAVYAIEKYSKVLKDKKATSEEKAVALKFIIHIIGDLHQPLHAGNGTDRGWNDLKLKFFWQPSNLHRVWDSGMIDNQKLSYSEWTQWLSRTITEAELKNWHQVDPKVWIAESTAIRDSIYPESKEISWDYQYENLPTLKRRLKQGGVRIAHYLNHIFK